MMKEIDSINPKKLVTEMRKQRAFLVQNWVHFFPKYLKLEKNNFK
jgi:hypothetical protein